MQQPGTAHRRPAGERDTVGGEGVGRRLPEYPGSGQELNPSIPRLPPTPAQVSSPVSGPRRDSRSSPQNGRPRWLPLTCPFQAPLAGSGGSPRRWEPLSLSPLLPWPMRTTSEIPKTCFLSAQNSLEVETGDTAPECSVALTIRMGRGFLQLV